MDLITRRVIADLEEGNEISEELLQEYAESNSEKYAAMCEEIRRRSNFTSLRFHRLDDMVESIGLLNASFVHIVLMEKKNKLQKAFPR